MDRFTCAIAVVVVMVVMVPDISVSEDPPGETGSQTKLRILVDKVMQPEEGWVTKEWMVREAVEAGFTVYSPRRGYADLDAVRQVTQWCAKYGIDHMPWMRGSLNAPDGPEAEGKRLVWASGNEQPLWSPNSDEFWEWTNRYITAYAQISVEMPHLIGVFLDYENYAPGREANLYSLSYDDLILQKFAEAQGIRPPELPLDQRKAWLEQEELHDAFEAFQIQHWRERCRALRKAVDRLNPKFRFCVYPAPGTPFMVKAIYPEWATQDAPLILADASSYGRTSRFLSQADALRNNRERLLQGMHVPRQAGIPFLYVGGIDPIVWGADPEFCGKNAVMISGITNGYWVFYEGPKYREDHPDYFRWFTWANKTITEGNFAVWQEPRESSEVWRSRLVGRIGQDLGLVPPEVTGERLTFPEVKLREEHVLLLAVRSGQPVEVLLQHHPIGDYQTFLGWDLRDPSLQPVATGIIPYGETGTVAFTPEHDGIYLLGASGGGCAYSVVRANVPVGLCTREKLALISTPGTFYFKVPDGVERFAITLRGSGARETVRGSVYDPNGNQVATGQTSMTTEEITLAVDAQGMAGQTWSLKISRAEKGTLEDYSIRLSSELPPVLALHPQHVFGRALE